MLSLSGDAAFQGSPCFLRSTWLCNLVLQSLLVSKKNKNKNKNPWHQLGCWWLRPGCGRAGGGRGADGLLAVVPLDGANAEKPLPSVPWLLWLEIWSFFCERPARD